MIVPREKFGFKCRARTFFSPRLLHLRLQRRRINYSSPSFLFRDSNQPALHLKPAHLAQRAPAQFSRPVPPMAFIIALNTTFASPSLHLFYRKRKRRRHLFANGTRDRWIGLSAMPANAARQPLRDAANQR